MLWDQQGNVTKKSYSFSNIDDDSSLLFPSIDDYWESETILARDHALVVSSKGFQNVTLRSRLFEDAHSKLHVTYSLKLVSEEPETEKSPLKGAADLKAAIKAIGEDFIEEPASLEREKQVCHECRTLVGLTKDYDESLTGKKAATVQAAVAYMKILERVRSGGPGTSKEDILKVLRELWDTRRHDVLASVLDALAGARSDQSILAAFEFLALPLNDDLDLSERFLSSLAASCVTAAAQGQHDSSHQLIVQELLVSASNWLIE